MLEMPNKNKYNITRLVHAMAMADSRDTATSQSQG